jgi:hypothetical protein
MSALLAEPNACYWCDTGKQHHGRRWASGVGLHGWISPPDRLRLLRMQTRRAVRLAAEQRRPS